MTSNQINLMKSREERRHNIATERETERANRVSQHIAMSTLSETKRRNLAQEELEREKNQESKRHNVAGESHASAQLQQTLTETNRHNLATEYQAMLNYGLDKERVYHAGLQTQISQYAAETARLTQAESARHNLASEQLQSQLNNQNYELATQSNALKQMDITQSNLLKYQTLEEQQRHNVALESETNRHNVVNERIDQNRQTTSVLTNVSDQTNKWFRSVMTHGLR